jgi:hypothetical protein
MANTPNPIPSPSPEPEDSISLVRDNVLFRAQRAVGLIPPCGLGLVRRAIFYPLLAWVPLALWAAWTHRMLPGPLAEPLLAHYSIHARLLLALPVLIIGEGLAHTITTKLVPQFMVAGLVPESEVPRFREIARGILRLRDSVWPWLVIAIMIGAWLAVPESFHPHSEQHELAWAENPPTPGWGFGGWWYRNIARPLFQIALFAWVWRLVLLGLLLWRISRLKLQLAPLHPDRVGGLGFLEEFPRMMAPFAFACSVVLSAYWAHQIMYHDAHVAAFKLATAVFAIAMLLICLAPLAVFIPRLIRTRRHALLQYGPLVGEHSRLVHRRWIAREQVGDPPILRAPELGPTCDVATLYQGILQMRAVPIGKHALMGVVLPVLLPLLVLFSIEIPIGELLGKIAKGLL